VDRRVSGRVSRLILLSSPGRSRDRVDRQLPPRPAGGRIVRVSCQGDRPARFDRANGSQRSPCSNPSTSTEHDSLSLNLDEPGRRRSTAPSTRQQSGTTMERSDLSRTVPTPRSRLSAVPTRGSPTVLRTAGNVGLGHHGPSLTPMTALPRIWPVSRSLSAAGARSSG